MMAIQTITIAEGIIVTPMTNSLMVRPREIRAINPATKGLNDMTQHQMNIVHQPFQESFQEAKGCIMVSGAT